MATSERAQALLTRLRQRIQYEAGVCMSAWLYFTRIPLPDKLIRSVNTKHSLSSSARYAPLVGIAIGSIAAVVFLSVYGLVENKGIAVVLALLASVLATGGMHEDGMAHFFDAFSDSNRSKKDILAQLKQPGIGAPGSLSLLFSVLLSYLALASLTPYVVAAGLIAAHAFARFAALSFVFTNSQADKPGAALPEVSPAAFLAMAAFGMLPLLLTGNLLFLLLVPLLWIVRALSALWFENKIGGWTADILSAVLSITTAIMYLLLAIASLHTFSL